MSKFLDQLGLNRLISLIKTALAALQSGLTALTGRVSKNEGDITSINSTLATLDETYVNVTGDTMTGNLVVPAAAGWQDALNAKTLIGKPPKSARNSGTADSGFSLMHIRAAGMFILTFNWGAEVVMSPQSGGTYALLIPIPPKNRTCVLSPIVLTNNSMHVYLTYGGTNGYEWTPTKPQTNEYMDFTYGPTLTAKLVNVMGTSGDSEWPTFLVYCFGRGTKVNYSDHGDLNE